ncbi:MAG: CHASE3 domain-containing protein [Gemmatimonadetes bacterium]|nr:CHASE3 domain-containing protein [Gemmatimonadota bacterium]
MAKVGDWFRDTRVRNKILFGYAVVVLFLVLVGVVVFVQGAMVDRSRAALDRVEQMQNRAGEMRLALADRVAAFRGYMISGDEISLDNYRSAEARFETAMAQAKSLAEDARQVARLDTASLQARAWVEEVAQPGIALRRAVEQGDRQQGDVLEYFTTGAGRSAADEARQTLRQLDERATAIAAAANRQMVEAIDRMRLASLLLTLLAVAGGIAVAVWIASRIAAPLTRAVGFAEAIAAGDLTGRIEAGGSDEIGRLVASLNAMATKLREVVSEVNEATTQVASAAEQIAATSERISVTVDQQVGATEAMSSSMEEIAAQISRVAQSAESLAASVDETSSSVAEMGQAIQSTAENTEALGSAVDETSSTIEEMAASISQAESHTRETRQIAESAAQDAHAGGAAVEQASGGIQRIHEEMESLVEIIQALGRAGDAVGRISGLMEDIADQTNLLALNASIEAARAGDQGRGFAVVAQEVRRLAERSVESAREIGSTIDEVRVRVNEAVDSTGVVAERTQEGMSVVEHAAAALSKILESSSRTRDLMDEMALAMEQQTQAATQTQEAVRHIQGIAEESRLATREQAQSSRQIIEAVESMNRQTQEVFSATAEQKRGGELILQSTEEISGGARQAQSAVQELVGAAQDLASQANRLTGLIKAFRV